MEILQKHRPQPRPRVRRKSQLQCTFLLPPQIKHGLLQGICLLQQPLSLALQDGALTCQHHVLIIAHQKRQFQLCLQPLQRYAQGWL